MTASDSQQPPDPHSTVPAFSPPIDPETASIARNYPQQDVPPGHVFVQQDELPSSVYLVRSGIVQLSYNAPDGTATTLGLHSEGWWAGGVLALLHMPSLCLMQSLTLCSFSILPAEDFLKTVMQNQRTLRHLLSSFARELLTMQQHSIMQAGSAVERLRYLQGESSQSIWSTADPTLVMRQGEIARLLSISPEHLSRLINREEHPPRKPPG